MERRLKLEMRHKQLYRFTDSSKPIVVKCNADGTAEYVSGTVKEPTWKEFTGDIENLDDFKATWQASTGDSDTTTGNSFGSNYSKGVSLELRFTGKAFDFIYDWLMKEPCQALNAIEVRITDLDCMKPFRVFEIKLDNTTYSPIDEPCIVAMRLREKDDVIHSFQKTILEDDWQGWFNRDGNSTKDHPTFLYVVEKKPKFILSILAALAYVVGILSVGLLIGLDDGKRWIRKLLGICYFCPAPLIRTYIENICQKYGYTHDTIFDDLPTNPYRDTCIFYPVEQNYQEFEDYDADSTKFIYENRTGMPFAKALDALRQVFNSEWYVTPNKRLIFKPRAFFDNQNPIYDFTTGAFPLVGLKYTFNGNKKAAYGDYSYKLDPSDQCTNEIKWRYDTIVDYDSVADNPMLEGNVTKEFEFGMTAFNRDGTVEPYFESAIKIGRIVAISAVVVGLGELLSGTGGLTVFIAVGLVALGYGITNGYINNFFQDPILDGVVRLSNNQINVPRLLLWDRATPMNRAKVVKVQNPDKNPQYNKSGNDYYQDHATRDEPGLFGGEIKDIYNYPLYIDENFKGNLYDRFHEYDNPLKNTEINQTWEGTVALCCEMLNIFGTWENDFAKIGAVVILENRNGRIIKGRVTSIEPDYKQGYLSLKGRVLK